MAPDSFNDRLGQIQQDDLLNYLINRTTPCYESRLLKIAFPEMSILNGGTLLLYQNHFALFHLLYKWQDDFFRKNQYLHIHFMRTLLLDYPPPGRCRYFDDDSLAFCAAPCTADNYCQSHQPLIDERALDSLSIRYFYLDPANFYKLDSQTADAFINGTWDLLSNYDAYIKNFDILGIPVTSDMTVIKKAFRQLAKQCHPDRGQNSHAQFCRINNAYQFLQHLAPFQTEK